MLVGEDYYLRNIKHFPYRYTVISTRVELEKREIVGNTTPEGRSVFTKFRVFPISTSVDITVYLYGKNVLYFFYNIAQEDTKLLQWMSKGKFSVFTSSYVNTAINQSAFRILKCYIIKRNVSMGTLRREL